MCQANLPCISVPPFNFRRFSRTKPPSGRPVKVRLQGLNAIPSLEALAFSHLPLKRLEVVDRRMFLFSFLRTHSIARAGQIHLSVSQNFSFWSDASFLTHCR